MFIPAAPLLEFCAAMRTFRQFLRGQITQNFGCCQPLFGPVYRTVGTTPIPRLHFEKRMATLAGKSWMLVACSKEALL